MLSDKNSERAKAIVEKLWGSKGIGLNVDERVLLEEMVAYYLDRNRFLSMSLRNKSELNKYQRLIDKKIIYNSSFQKGVYSVSLNDVAEQEVQNAVENEGMAKGGKVKEWITANSDKVAYPKLRTPDKKIWTLHSSCKTREEAEAKRDALRDGFYDDAKILDIYDGTNQKIYVYVTGEKETGKEPLCKITVIENGKKVVLNCFTEEEKKETFEEIKLRKLPIVDVKNKMAGGGSAGESKNKTLEYVNKKIQEKYPDLEAVRHRDRPRNKPTYYWDAKEGTKTADYVNRQYSQTITSYVDLNTPIEAWIAEADIFMAEFKLPEKERKYDYGYATGGDISGSRTLLEDSPVNINFSKGTFSERGLSKEQIEFLKQMEKLWREDKLNQKSRLATIEKYKRTGRGEEILDALEYWESLSKPMDKESAFHPVYLTDYLVGGGKFSLQITVGGEFNSRSVAISPKLENLLKEASLLYPVSPKNYYFKITQSGDLYIEYQSIIGSRMIASNVIVDYNKGGDISGKSNIEIFWLITG